MLENEYDRSVGAKERYLDRLGRPLQTEISGRDQIRAAQVQGLDAARLESSAVYMNALSNLQSAEYLEDINDHVIQKMELSTAMDWSTMRIDPRTGRRGHNYNERFPDGRTYEEQGDVGKRRRREDIAEINRQHTVQLLEMSKLASRMAEALTSENPAQFIGQINRSRQYDRTAVDDLTGAMSSWQRMYEQDPEGTMEQINAWIASLKAGVQAGTGG